MRGTLWLTPLLAFALVAACDSKPEEAPKKEEPKAEEPKAEEPKAEADAPAAWDWKLPKGRRLALLVVFLVLLIAYRSLGLALACYACLLLGLLCTCALLPILDMRLGLFNMVVIPLLIGVGVDANIHILHRSKEHLPHTRPLEHSLGNNGESDNRS